MGFGGLMDVFFGMQNGLDNLAKQSVHVCLTNYVAVCFVLLQIFCRCVSFFLIFANLIENNA